MDEPNTLSLNQAADYNDDSIIHLEDMEHIRLRPGMYIGKLGDGSSHDDGIYVLIKEVIDNAIDEFTSGFGRRIDMTVNFADRCVSIRDYGRGIPLGKMVEAVSKLNTGAKYDSKVFQKSVGLNGVGTKAVNALSSRFRVQAFRDGKTRTAEFADGRLTSDSGIVAYAPPDGLETTGTLVEFVPDPKLFGNYHFINEYVERRVWNYCYLNRGLAFYYNDKRFYSKNGLLDLLEHNMEGEPLYPLIHIKEGDFEAAFTHVNGQNSDYYYSFVNGQHTTEGGTHQSAFREGYARVVKEFYNKKEFAPEDVRQGLVCALCIRIQEPVFEAQTKTKLGSTHLAPNRQDGSNDSPFLKTYVLDILKRHLDNYLHIHSDTAEALLDKIQRNEKERKDIAGIKKLAKESSRKASLNNSKLRDCRIHYNSNHPRRLESTIFITEGLSASGSITKSRDVETQAVFSLRGKPLNTVSSGKAEVYKNEELNLLHNALDIDDGMENLRYNNVVIATDADVDGMHIRLLLLTFFLRFYPELVREGHVYILQTPLFRVRNKQKTTYCYSDDERLAAIAATPNPEITRFKGLGEISPDEFKGFIDSDMRLDPVLLHKDFDTQGVLRFYMGQNTSDRREFIMQNLRVEEDEVIKN
uniref:DNA topoisomerase (ATP-hydrolyzing) n=1 Tax=uncultured bacterium fosmid pJB17E7_contig I TaxID=1478055 RepID=A0A0H3U7A1_9BACT|nr:putative type IIA topoisomerase, B subunit [uncultured bacterium fosmid pJB17E7_contig I]